MLTYRYAHMNWWNVGLTTFVVCWSFIIYFWLSHFCCESLIIKDKLKLTYLTYDETTKRTQSYSTNNEYPLRVVRYQLWMYHIQRKNSMRIHNILAHLKLTHVFVLLKFIFGWSLSLIKSQKFNSHSSNHRHVSHTYARENDMYWHDKIWKKRVDL